MILDLLGRVSLTVAESRQASETLTLIVNGLVTEAHFALARIWLIESDSAADFPTKHLRLSASAGSSNRLDGAFSKIPLGARKIGWVGMTGEPVLIEDLTSDNKWVAEPDWVTREGMQSFAGHPLIFKGEVFGVLGIFSRQRIPLQQLKEIRLFADHAAISLANARAFDEITVLRRRLELENTYLQEQVRETANYGAVIGRSPAMQKILQQVELVAPTNASVLILGESGTGKELIAHSIHEASKRRARPMVKVNCAAIPRELFESEFFGHVKGSFTGAMKDRVGRFQLADQGTLFLDEVGEIPLELQSKLLRVLQEGEIQRVGDDATRKVDVRVIAASNRQLGDSSESFRQDLYYRLSVFPIVMPPLRDRKEDIAALTAHFVRHSSRQLGLPEPRITVGALEALSGYDWPGNIRELQHVIERAVIIGRGQSLPIDLPRRSAPPVIASGGVTTAAAMRQLEMRNYQSALDRAGGKIYGPNGAAALLGIPPTTLASRLKALKKSKT